MNIEQVRTYTLSLPGVTEDMPFGDDVVTFRIEGKIFLTESHACLVNQLPKRLRANYQPWMTIHDRFGSIKDELYAPTKQIMPNL